MAVQNGDADLVVPQPGGRSPAPSSPERSTRVSGGAQGLVSGHGSGGDGLPWFCILAGRDDGICAAVGALVPDLPRSERDHFGGVDNVSAGRTVVQRMGRFVRRTKRVLAITGSRLARERLERRQGFDLVMSVEFPDLEGVASMKARDDPAIIQALLPEVFGANADLCGIYCSAAGNPGLIGFLNDNRVSKDLVVIAHELTPSSKVALLDGTFDAPISQDTGRLVQSAERLPKATADRVPFNPVQERIRIDIYLKENIPPDVPAGQQGGRHEDNQGTGAVSRAIRGRRRAFQFLGRHHQMGGGLWL